MKKTFIFLVAFLMLTAFTASAATFKGGEVYEHKGKVVNDDMYIAGGVIDISGDINGDGVMAGGDVSVLGDVTQDLNIAGGSVRLLGSVGDDARVAGGNVAVSSNVAGDLVAVGGFVRILSDSAIKGDAVIAGGEIIMNGDISGDLTVYGEKVTINGQVDGNVSLKFTKDVVIGEDALISGNLTYSAREGIEIPEGVLIGGTVTRVESPINRFEFDKGSFKKFIGLLLLAKLLLMLVAGVLAVIVFKQFSKTVAVSAHDDFWKNALIGFIVLILVPIISFLLFATVVGAFVGFIAMCAYILLLLISKVYAGIVAGLLLSKWIKKEKIMNWKWAALGIIAVQVIVLVPLFGSLVAFIIMLATLGTIGTLVYKKFWVNR